MKAIIVLLLFAPTLFFTGCGSAPKESSAGSTSTQKSGTAAAPELRDFGVELSSDYFSPDGDGENDNLSITLGTGTKDVASWVFDIYQPDLATAQGQSEPRKLKHFEGQGLPPNPTIVWDGKGDEIEVPRRNAPEGGPQTRKFTPRVMSATDYPYKYVATNLEGEVIDTAEGVIQVDVLVRDTGDGRKQIQVPSIRFRSNAADFKDLDERVVKNNERVLGRIATALNKFETYKVLIEGHTNPLNAPGTDARTAEDSDPETLSLSEQRAKAILDKLVEDGVAKDRLSASGVGSVRPTVDFDDKDNAWQNRRVEFYLSSK